MKISSRETYFSIDIEADGPIPGINSMLSLGAAAFRAGELIGTHTVNLDLLPGAVQDPATMKWWQGQGDAYAKTRENAQPPEIAIPAFVTWVGSITHKPVCAAYPAGYDFMWLYWYLVRFNGDSPFSFSCLDIKTLAMAKLGIAYRDTTKRNMPKRWFDGVPPHKHVALDDAIEQGWLLMRILGYDDRG